MRQTFNIFFYTDGGRYGLSFKRYPTSQHHVLKKTLNTVKSSVS
jgi:hypothetical protein